MVHTNFTIFLKMVHNYFTIFLKMVHINFTIFLNMVHNNFTIFLGYTIILRFPMVHNYFTILLYKYISVLLNDLSMLSFTFQCAKIVNSDEVKMHIQMHYETTGSWTCPYKEAHWRCGEGAFQRLYSNHTFRYHRGEKVPQWNEDASAIDNYHQHNDDNAVEDTDEERKEEEANVDDDASNRTINTFAIFQEVFHDLLMTLEYENNIAGRIVDLIVAKFYDLSNAAVADLLRRIKDVAGTSEIYENISDILQDNWLSVAASNNKYGSVFLRKKSFQEACSFVPASYVKVTHIPHHIRESTVAVVDLKSTIEQHLRDTDWEGTNLVCKPTLYTEQQKHLSAKFEPADEYMNNYFQSKRFSQLEDTVPEEERPALHLEFYADGWDRDKVLHSSRRNKVHATYFRVLNTCRNRPRSPEDYNLAQLMYALTMKKMSYNESMELLIDRIKEIVCTGITYKGRKHAVRVARIIGDGQERAMMTGMPASFSAVAYYDPFSFATNAARTSCTQLDDIRLTDDSIRTREEYEIDIGRIPTELKGKLYSLNDM